MTEAVEVVAAIEPLSSEVLAMVKHSILEISSSFSAFNKSVSIKNHEPIESNQRKSKKKGINQSTHTSALELFSELEAELLQRRRKAEGGGGDGEEREGEIAGEEEQVA